MHKRLSDITPFIPEKSKSGPVIKYGTVTQAKPLKVMVDGDTTATSVNAACSPLVGQRVVMVLQDRILTAVATLHSDTGWIDIPLVTTAGAGWTAYPELTPQYRSKNGWVIIRGAVTPNSERVIDGEPQTFGTIPAAYCPNQMMLSLDRAQAMHTVSFRVRTTGELQFERLVNAGTAEYATASTDFWLRFYITYPVE